MVFEAMVALISGDAVAGTAAVDRLVSLPAFSDPEGLYYWAHSCMGFGDHERALELLEKAVDLGMHCVRGLEVTPALEPVRATTRFRAVVDRARAAQTAAEKAFADAQGASTARIAAAAWHAPALAQQQICIQADKGAGRRCG
jgi:hypothetical protein